MKIEVKQNELILYKINPNIYIHQRKNQAYLLEYDEIRYIGIVTSDFETLINNQDADRGSFRYSTYLVTFCKLKKQDIETAMKILESLDENK